MKANKVYKFRLYPNAEQQVMFVHQSKWGCTQVAEETVQKTGRRETVRGFKSYQLRQNGILAQLVERQIEDLRVRGSIP